MGSWPPPVLDPAGPYAAPVTILAWALFAMGVLVLLVVLVALALALFGPAAWRRRLGGERAIWIGGVGFPVVVLSLLLVWGLSLTARLTEPAPPDALRIRVTGHMWWWRVAYLEDGREAFQTANEIRIPAGRPVVVEAEAGDVIHSLWIPRLSGKIDMIPGRRNHLTLQAAAPGVYRGQCAEFCGLSHALMGLEVIALEPAAFAAWRAVQMQGAVPPADAAARRGAAVFDAAGCGVCHTVRGTAANELAGPDLTHVGGRRTLGAAILPNDRATAAGWIIDAGALKPGARMPAYHVLPPEELDALTAYLASLK